MKITRLLKRRNFIRILIAIAIIFSVSALLVIDCYVDSHPLCIGIMGDQTGTYPDETGKYDIKKAYAALEKGVSILSKQKVKLVLHVGDIVESSEKSTEVYTCNFITATQILDKLRVPWFLTPGDHDVNPEIYQPGSNDRSKETLFRNLYAKRLPQLKNNLYYSFDFNGYHFIALYSHENLHVDPRWGNIFMARISDEQFNWLDQDLRRNKKSKGIIVFLHQPLWYNWSGWIRVHQLLRKYPVATVIAGHFHYNQDEGQLDGIRYVIVGATGGTLKRVNRDAGNAWQVTIMTIRDKKVDYQLLALNDSKSLPLTPRNDMDRIQAIDTMLGNLPTGNNIYLKSNRLFDTCDTDKPASLNLALGNPIDIPIEVDLKFIAKNIELSSPSFIPSICQAPITGYQCVIPPGKGIVSSNLSDVQLSYNCAIPNPIWVAHPVVTGTVQSGDKVDLSIRVSFQGKLEKMFSERDISTVIQSCNK